MQPYPAADLAIAQSQLLELNDATLFPFCFCFSLSAVFTLVCRYNIEYDSQENLVVLDYVPM
jgi:hypothetical protein